MKAMMRSRYGSGAVLELREVPTPVPGPDEILVRVRAASVNPYDWHQVAGLPLFMRLSIGLRRPKDPLAGLDFAGEVEAVGAAVTRYAVGDRVFGLKRGAFAEYVCVAETGMVAVVPPSVSFASAGATPLAGITALQALRDKGSVASGQRVAVTGAGGGIGSFAVQLAKHFGAHVTGVCSGGKVSLVRSLGADEVVDYGRTDYTTRGPYDLIIDNAGGAGIRAVHRALAPGGRIVIVGGPEGGRVLGPLSSMLKWLVLSRRAVSLYTASQVADLEFLASLLASGAVVPALGASFPLAGAGAAVDQVRAGHTTGKLTLTP